MRVRRSVMAAIAEHARRDYPRECCGLLVGGEAEVTEAVPTRNTATDPLCTYEISPEDHFTLIRRCRDGVGGAAVVGGYHSHPHSRPDPSVTDRERAFSDFLYLIAGPADGSATLEVRGYRVKGSVMEPVTLSIVE